MKPYLCIDADNFTYTAGAYERHYLVKDGGCIKLFKAEQPGAYKCKLLPPLEFCIKKVDYKINRILKLFNTDKFQLFLSPSDGSNFRDKIAVTKPYKGNRTQPKPEYYKELREHMIKNYGAIVAEGQEADDAVTIEALAKNGVICSNDKDVLYGVPGFKFDYDKDKLFKTTEEEAWYYFCKQCLMGDAGDNIPGLPGVGPVNADKTLKIVDEEFVKVWGVDNTLWQKVVAAYANHFKNELAKDPEYWGLWDDYARDAYIQEQATLLFIRRKPNDEYRNYL